MNDSERRTLLFIRLALLVTTVATCVVALLVRDRIDEPEDTRALQYAFAAQGAFALFMLFVLKRMTADPRNQARRVPLTIVAWAVAESVAVLGAVIVMLGAEVWYLAAGLLVFYIAGRTHPVAG